MADGFQLLWTPIAGRLSPAVKQAPVEIEPGGYLPAPAISRITVSIIERNKDPVSVAIEQENFHNPNAYEDGPHCSFRLPSPAGKCAMRPVCARCGRGEGRLVFFDGASRERRVVSLDCRRR